MAKQTKIIYTKVDEAPALATYSLLPIVQAFTSKSGLEIEIKDISLASRILASFSEKLKENQKVSNDLESLSKLVKTPEANIVKLPNISASVPQLLAAIAELKEKGFDIPTYPENPSNDEEKEIKKRYSTILGSAVNPVLREGNSDRRAAGAVKEYAKKNPHKMAAWSSDSKTHVASMEKDDFFGSEKSITLDKDTHARYEFVNPKGEVTVLKESLPLLKGEILDAAVMHVKALEDFITKEIDDAKENGTLFSVHLKATMMKVSDPVIFGHVVKVFYKDVLEKHADTIKKLGVDLNNGISDLYAKMGSLPEVKRAEIEADIEKLYAKRPKLAMVDSDNGVTNLHMPNKVIIDASMPVVIRDGGKMWNAQGKLQDTKAVIPDRCYASFYQVAIEDCQKNGAYDPTTLGTVSNVGLMAQKAEEYGSHDKTFIAPADGVVRVVDANGTVLLEQSVQIGDIYRGCQTKDIPIQDWVKLAVNRANATKTPAIFWLDKNRAHDAEVITKVEKYLKEHETNGLEISIKAPDNAIRYTLERMRKGLDTISVSGNALRDYLTDLFPIIELGSSSKMLSIVPLLAGGGLYETGAGGSAPKHVEQFMNENHLRWDSLGEFLALWALLDTLAFKNSDKKLSVLAKTLDNAISKILDNGKSPSRKVGELDNRGSHFYLALYWAEELSAQKENKELADAFSKFAKELSVNEEKILSELNAVQGKPVDMGGYYKANDELTAKTMRPSKTLNSIIDSMLNIA
jgi:isocitrate dehydrogenase